VVEQFPVIRRVYGQGRTRILRLDCGAAYIVPPGSPADAMAEVDGVRGIFPVDIRNRGVYASLARFIKAARDCQVNITEDGAPVPDVIEAVKRAIKAANVSATDQGRDLRVGSVSLILHAIATRSSGGGLNFHIPFIGMKVQVGAKLIKHNTHQIQINLTAPWEKDRVEIRDSGLDDVLVEAIETIRAAVASAAGGDDPFVLNDSTITLSFAVTAEGSISIGVNGSLNDELTHTLALALVPAQRPQKSMA
jgi:Trypsin-co-occurring domain 2